MEVDIVHYVRWFDARGMVADGHAEGRIGRQLILQVTSGTQTFKHER